MKKFVFVKTAALILTFAMLLVVGVALVAAMESGSEALDETSLTPESNVTDPDTPISQTELAGTFGAYTVVTEEDGKKIANIYSASQMEALVEAKQEWVCLSEEELLYLIDDTRTLFETCDEINITLEDGSVSTYTGFPKYLSAEFRMECLRGMHDDDFRPSSVLNDLRKAVYERISPLHSASYFLTRFGGGGSYVYYTGAEAPMSDWDVEMTMHYAYSAYFGYREVSYDVYARSFQASSGILWNDGATFIYTKDYTDVKNNSVALNTFVLPDAIREPWLPHPSDDGLWENMVDFDVVPEDKFEDHSVYVVLYDRATDEAVASTIVIAKYDPETVSMIESLWTSYTEEDVTVSYDGIDTSDCRYYAKVYFNNMPGFAGISGLNSYAYLPDGDLNLFTFCYGTTDFGTQVMGGFAELNACINQLIAEYIG